MRQVFSLIREELKQKSDPRIKKQYQRFFKEKIKAYGVKTPAVREISKKYFREVKNLAKKRIFSLCEELLKSGYNEEIAIALDWVYRIKKQFTKSDFPVFERWLKKYITNWGTCDDLCVHILGYFLFQYPEFLKKTELWAKSKNRWLRRASTVSLIYSLRRGRALEQVFRIADILLEDEDDLVRKGYGWMLKEASNIYRKEVFEYVLKNRKQMPRVAFRYAIEKMPKEMKKEVMRN
jgi:3-methyladenine DNA glycosylase AlkD